MKLIAKLTYYLKEPGILMGQYWEKSTPSLIIEQFATQNDAMFEAE